MSEARTCPLERLFKQLSGPWTLLVMWVLYHQGSRQFGQLRREMQGVSTKMLTERLRMLESLRIVARTVSMERLRTVSYSLTPAGVDLFRLLEPVYEFATRQLDEIARPAMEG